MEIEVSQEKAKPKQRQGRKRKVESESEVVAKDENMDNVNKKPKASPQKIDTFEEKGTIEIKEANPSEPLEELKEESQPKKKFNYYEYKNRGPSAPGSKEIPTGQENCLQGLTFVFTGELSSISREESDNLVKRYAGRVTSAVSGKTSYLVVGEMAGESKTKKAKEKKIPVLNEDEFYDLIRSLPAKGDQSLPVSAKAKASAQITIVAPPVVKAKDEISNKGKSVNSKPTIERQQSFLWSDKYRPQSLNELCGNYTIIKRLEVWVQSFFSPGKSRITSKDASFKAALLSGPPGIGKTTSAHLVCRSLGLDVLEFNASDTRSKGQLDNYLHDAISNYSIQDFVKQKEMSKSRKGNLVVIMDEVDGMSSGDRGGMAQLIALIKKSKVPIICICNDRSSPKVRSLSNYCMDLRFRRPDVNAIRPRLLAICQNEGLQIPSTALDQLITSSQSDIRQLLNILSTWRLSQSSMDFDQGRSVGKKSEKDYQLGLFDIVPKYLSGSSYKSSSLKDKFDYYFHDYSLAPLIVQENYLRCKPLQVQNVNSSDASLKALECVFRAADSISLSDKADKQIHSANQWDLMPTHALLSCILPGHFMHGHVTQQYSFPGWLGQNSKQSKFYRLLRELQIHMRLKISGDKNELRQAYIPLLAPVITRPLIENGANGIQETIERMDAYYINREDLETITELGLGSLSGLLNGIPSTVKAAFTRSYNKVNHPTAVPLHQFSKVSKMQSSGPAPDFEDAVIEDDAENLSNAEENSDAEDIKNDKMIKSKTQAKKGTKGVTRKSSKAKATSSRGRK